MKYHGIEIFNHKGLLKKVLYTRNRNRRSAFVLECESSLYLPYKDGGYKCQDEVLEELHKVIIGGMLEVQNGI